MGHEVETAAFGKTPAWHRLGEVLDDEVVDARTMMNRSGLTWEVELVPLYMPTIPEAQGAFEAQFTAPGGGLLPMHLLQAEHVAVRRNSDGKYLGNVSEGWKPVQPFEVFDFMDVLTDPRRAGALGDVQLSVAEAQAKKAVAKYHTAGSLRGGKEVWVLVKVGENARIAGVPEEEHERFVFCTNGYDGKTGLRVMFTEVRVVCANTQQMAIRGAKRIWTFTHTGDIMEKLDQARQVLMGADQYFATFEETAEKLLATKLSPTGFKRLLDHLVPLNAIRDDATGRKVQGLQRVRNNIEVIFQTEQNLDHCRGTAWAAYNAVTQYEDHERTVRGSDKVTADERRFERAMLDTGMKDRAAEYLLAL